jgi:Secretion system C-terminal sorting domain
MKKSLIKLFTLLLFSTLAYAQEREYELKTNPKLFSKAAQTNTQSKIAVSYKKITLFVKDTLSLGLPFVDDFSSDKFTSYNIQDYSNSAITNAIRYSFKVNGVLEDSVNYIKDTAYSYTYNPTTNLLDSTKISTPDYVISFYDDLTQPSQVTSTLDGWIPYYKPIYDTIADTIKFIFLVQLDTTRFLEIDSLTLVKTEVFPIPGQSPLWYENEVFVNSTYPINPPSIGVATFDGLDSTGFAYNFANTTTAELCDKLTSKYLDLSPPLGSNDSLVLTFFYQPKGRGNTPESTDSLILDFKAKDGSWGHVWSSPGLSSTFLDTVFKKVNIRIKDASYLYDGFQFRFKNYATPTGNVDHWHLDYVRLKKISSPTDLIFNDIAFVYPPQSPITTYQTVPYTQYDNSMMKSNITNTIVNLNTAVLNYGFYEYSVVDNIGLSIGSYAAGVTTNINSSYFADGSVDNGNFVFAPATLPPINFNYSDTLTSCRNFTVTHKRTGTPDQIGSNDIITATQAITDYFSYDDASAESAYGLVQAGAQGALKFTLRNPDDLSGVYIYFNPAVQNATNKVFKLTVWNEVNNLPGAIIYQNPKNYSPSYNNVIDGFFKLDLDTLLNLPAGNFFIGWVQSTANELNIGLDKNNNNGDKLYYNIGSGWLQSIISGSLMLHPVFSSCPSLNIGLKENKKQKASLEVYPNPANDKLFFRSESPFVAQVSIIDLTGKTVLAAKQSIAFGLDISELNQGIYFVRIEHSDLHTFDTKKIVVIK